MTWTICRQRTREERVLSGSSLTGRWLSSRRGQALVETELILPIFLLLGFGIIEFGRLLYTQATLQHAMREAARFGVTGNKLPDPNNPYKNLTRNESIKAVARKQAIGISLNTISVNSSKGGVDAPGGPGETISISLSTDVRLITPIIAAFFDQGVYRIVVNGSFKNEPFPPSQSN